MTSPNAPSPLRPNAPSPPPSLANQRILVMGLGRLGGGVAVTRWLAQQGAHVTVTDTDSPENLADSLAQLNDLPIQFKLGGHDLADFAACDLLVANPAVDQAASPYIQAARHARIPITTEINLFLQRCPATTIAVTGSVGKSTTTTLIHLALQAALAPSPSRPLAPAVFLGGNIGKSLLLDLPNIRPNDLVVLEISSFMLENTPAIGGEGGGGGGGGGWSPNIAVVTNLYPNHLDRHHTLEEYAAVKQNLLKFQRPTDLAILNDDHPLVRAWAPLVRGRLLTYTTANLPLIPLQIPGSHNQSNARAALAVLDALATLRSDLPLHRPAALAALAAFTGLPHRLQLVHTSSLTRGGQASSLRWFNDSKATTPDASITALLAFDPGTVICIVGGYDKHVGMSAFEALLAQRALGVLGIGQTGAAITERLRALRPRAGRRIGYAETLDRAVTVAHTWAAELTDPRYTSDPVPALAILLSPASASWGQFQNYEHRGALFTRLAQQFP